MSDNTSHKDEEIDLGQLLALISRGGVKVGNSIKSIFELVMMMLQGFLFFFKRHFKKFLVVGVIGGIIGVTIDRSQIEKFEASMVVKPNYQSGRQLYKNIAYYDELIKQEKFQLLSETFSITIEEAQSLISFEIEPVINENYMLSTYDEFLSSIDSTVALNFEYSSYTENFKDYSFSEHQIMVQSTLNNIFPRLENTIVYGIKNNPFFKQLEESESSILKRNESYLLASLQEIDTLRRVYTEVLIKESEKEISQGTSINMAAGGNENIKEIELFNEEKRINQSIDRLNRIQVRNIEILNVISSFQKIGFKKDNLVDKWMIRMPLILILLVFIGLVFIELNSLKFFRRE